MDTLTVSRVFAIAVREVMPTLVRRRQSYTFAEHRCAWLIGSRGRMVETGIRRLALCASDILRQGFVAFGARVRPSRPSGCTLHVRIAGAGPLRPHGDVERALSELGLEAEAGDTGGSAQLRRAHGTCPATQAHVEFAGLPLAGFIFNAAYTLRDASELEPQPSDATARAGRAPRLWLLQPDALNAASITAQAQSHGWATSQALRFNVLPTDTTLSVGADMSSTDDKWLRTLSAEQKLFGGPFSVTGSVSETASGEMSKSLRAGFKRTW